jgi:glycosyltransferase involved in cell wall biosynthesis
MTNTINPLLSICIPSTNQPNELKRLLTSLYKYGGNRIEIIVHDGATNDEAKKIVESFDDHLPLRYINKEREFDEAIIEMVDLANGEYIWGIGDDDIYEDSISSVIEVIEREMQPDFIFANFEVEETGVLHSNLPSRYFRDREEILNSIGSGIGFGPACIYKAQFGKRALGSASQFKGMAFMSMYFPLYAIAHGSTFFHLQGPIIRCYPTRTDDFRVRFIKDNGAIDNPCFQVFGVNFQNIFLSFRQCFKKEDLNRFLNKNFSSTWRGVLVGAAGGWDTTKHKKWSLIQNFYRYPECWLALILFSLPDSVIRYLYKQYRVLKYGKTT